MTSLAQRPHDDDHGLGFLLRRLRGIRGQSQLDLATATGISQRHISFVESGRSVPSRPTLLALARALDVPLRERNVLLLAAGYAPVYSEAPLDDGSFATVMRAVDLMLRRHDPFPALVLDRHWNVIRTNEAAPRFFSRFVDLSRHPRQRNLLRLMFDPQGLRPFIANWDRTADALLQRVHLESLGRVVDEGTQALLESLRAFPAVRAEGRGTGTWEGASTAPVVPIGFVHQGDVLNYFSLVATVGTPQAVAAQELRIECMFPADEATEKLHSRLFGE